MEVILQGQVHRHTPQIPGFQPPSRSTDAILAFLELKLNCIVFKRTLIRRTPLTQAVYSS